MRAEPGELPREGSDASAPASPRFLPSTFSTTTSVRPTAAGIAGSGSGTGGRALPSRDARSGRAHTPVIAGPIAAQPTARYMDRLHVAQRYVGGT